MAGFIDIIKTMNLKSKIREEVLTQRYNLSETQVREKSELIASKIISEGIFTKTNFVSLYISAKGEVATKPLINYFTKTRAKVYLPKFLENCRSYALCRFGGWNNLEKGPFGILQPKGEEIIAVKSIALVFLPGVAYDKGGNRLGWGKGVYDRLFEASNATLVGLAYEFQIVDEIPKEEHDLVMDYVVTEKRVLKF